MGEAAERDNDKACYGVNSSSMRLAASSVV